MKNKFTRKVAAFAVALIMLSGTAATVSATPDVDAQAIDSALVIDENIGNTYDVLYKFVSDNQLTGYVALNADKKVEVVCYTAGQLNRVKKFAAENGLDDSLIVYRVDENMDLSVTDGGEISLATNEELEQLVNATVKLNEFISENGYTDTSAYASLKWYRHSVSLFVKNDKIQNEAIEFIEKNGIERNLVDVVLSPEYNFSVADGGQNDSEEVNIIVAAEYLAIKDYMSENNYLSNIFLTLKHNEEYNVDVTMIEVYVKEQKEADALARYMIDNHFWTDVVQIKTTNSLAPAPENAVRNKSFVVLEGDTNDDGEFGVADVICLQKYLLGAAEINERQSISSNIYADDSLDVFDLVFAKRKLLDAINSK